MKKKNTQSLGRNYQKNDKINVQKLKNIQNYRDHKNQ